jgi:hypothetical protein
MRPSSACAGLGGPAGAPFPGLAVRWSAGSDSQTGTEDQPPPDVPSAHRFRRPTVPRVHRVRHLDWNPGELCHAPALRRPAGSADPVVSHLQRVNLSSDARETRRVSQPGSSRLIRAPTLRRPTGSARPVVGHLQRGHPSAASGRATPCASAAPRVPGPAVCRPPAQQSTGPPAHRPTAHRASGPPATGPPATGPPATGPPATGPPVLRPPACRSTGPSVRRKRAWGVPTCVHRRWVGRQRPDGTRDRPPCPTESKRGPGREADRRPYHDSCPTSAHGAGRCLGPRVFPTPQPVRRSGQWRRSRRNDEGRSAGADRPS